MMDNFGYVVLLIIYVYKLVYYMSKFNKNYISKD